MVIEVNGNPSFDDVFDATGKDMAVPIAEYVGRRALSRRLARMHRQQVRLELLEEAAL